MVQQLRSLVPREIGPGRWSADSLSARSDNWGFATAAVCLLLLVLLGVGRGDGRFRRRRRAASAFAPGFIIIACAGRFGFRR